MCLGIPGEVVELYDDRPDLAKVDVSGVRRAINIGLLEDEDIQPGDWILIHVGFALSKIDEQEAAAAIQELYPDWLVGIRQDGVVMGLEFDHPEGARVCDAAGPRKSARVRATSEIVHLRQPRNSEWAHSPRGPGLRR